MKSALGILLVIAIIIILLQQLCKPPVKDTVGRAQYAALEQRMKDTTKYYEELLKADSAAINEAHQAAADQYEKSEVYRRAVNDKQTTIDRLVAKVEAGKNEKQDSSWVKVSPTYKEACDSLPAEIVELKKRNLAFQEQNSEAHRLLLYETGVRDSALDDCHEFNLKFKSQLDDCMRQLKGKVNVKQRVQLYAGIGLFGNRINPLGGGQVNVSLRARNGQMYEISGATIGNTWYGGVGTKMLLTFR